MNEFINKLIERLEKETYDMEICEEQFDMNRPYFKDVPYKMVKMDDIKDIVNQLAEEYAKDKYVQTIDVAELVEKYGQENGRGNDGCEWNRNYQFISDKYKVETGCGYTFYDLHHAEPFAHCPYCGKRIAPYQPKGE